MPTNSGLNGELFYTDETGTYSHAMWVMELSQPHTLNGQTAQSRTRRQFYPRYYAPGNITVKGRAASQESYQALVWFIRRHQRAIINTPADERFARTNINGKGYQRLMRLSVPSEHLIVRGFVPTFSIMKKGVHDVAPQFSFDFFVVFDQTASNIEISNRIQKYYDTNDYALATAKDQTEQQQTQDFIQQDILDPFHHRN